MREGEGNGRWRRRRRHFASLWLSHQPHHCDVREQGRVVRPRRKVGEDDGGEDARPPRCRIVAVIVLLCPRRG